ncbi:HAUS1 protein, partial [Spelaeornis formosus]|nr:HAUS1 protein [Elachura formosa]
QVNSWLKEFYGPKPVPQYKVNENTVDLLYRIMKCNEERDKDIMLVIEDMEDQAVKYEEQADYWENILEADLGFFESWLSQDACKDIADLVDSAMELMLDDTSLTSFYSAINDMTAELYATKSKNDEMEMRVKTLTNKLALTLALEKKLMEDVTKVKEMHEAENNIAEKRLKNLEFLKAKSVDLKIRIKSAENELIGRGLDQSVTHEALGELAE